MRTFGRTATIILLAVTLITPSVSSAQSTLWESLFTRIKSILAQINLLEHDVAVLQQAQTASVATAVTPTFTRTLKEGDTGQDVTDLQTYLAQDATLYPEGKVTGVYGPLTTAAVKRFQERYAIEQTGTVGPQTRAKIQALNQTQTQTQTTASIGTAEDGTKFKKGEILVKLTPGTPSQNPDATFKRYGLSKKDTIPGIDVHIVSVPEGKEEQVRDALAKNPNVEFVELNVAAEANFVPNDPSFGSQWHHTKIGSREAWDVASHTPVTIGIMDTGVDVTHPDLAASIVPGWNTVSNNTDVTDIHGHGTWVAGTAAAVGNNGIGVAGVAYDAKIMPLRISESADGYAYWSDIAEAVTWAADHGAKVASASYAACDSSTVRSAATYMRGKGGLVTIAEGNANADAGNPDTPELICVSATGSDDARASWSSYGADVDVSAPGVGIYTTSKGGGYASVSGTSFATPNTAGLIALIWGVNPSFEPGTVEDILKMSAKDLGDPGWDKYYGWGRIDAAAAVTLAKNTQGPLPDTQAPVTSITSPANGSTVSGTVSVSVSATDNKEVTRVELLKNGVLFATDTTAPYSFSWNTINDTNGSYTLSAKAYDAAGNVGVTPSAPVTVTVANTVDTTAPTVSITSPLDGSKLTAKNLIITASAKDDVGVTEIVLSMDGAAVGTCASVTTCSKTILAKKVKTGTHTVAATARDARGNTGTATTVTFTK